MNLRKYALQISAMAVLVLSALIIFLPSAKADGPGAPETPTDSYSQEEAPERMVECENYVFVPLDEDGTWECPKPGEPLPDCKDALVNCACDHFLGGCTGGYPPEGEGAATPRLVRPGEANAAPTESKSRITPTTGFAAGAALLLVAAGTLYMIYRKPKGD